MAPSKVDHPLSNEEEFTRARASRCGPCAYDAYHQVHFFAFLLDALHLTKLPTCGWPLRPPPQPQAHAGEDNLEFEKISSMKSCLLPSAGMLEYYLARASTVCSPFINSHLHQSYILQQDWRPHQDLRRILPARLVLQFHPAYPL